MDSKHPRAWGGLLREAMPAMETDFHDRSKVSSGILRAKAGFFLRAVDASLSGHHPKWAITRVAA